MHDIALAQIDDLTSEIAAHNHVRVTKWAAISKPGQRTIRKRVMDELAHKIAATPAALVLADELRMLTGRKPIYLDEAIRRLGGELVSVTPNLRTTVGIDFAANVLGNATQPAAADWIALSNNTASVAAGDASSTLPWNTAQATDAAASGTTGEWTALGLARKLATYGHTNGVASYTMSATWTATASSTATSRAGMFGGSNKTAQGNNANNILFLENTFTATSLATNDQLSLVWTVNI